jgi:hypothetical protein
MIRRVLQTGLFSVLLVACNVSTPIPPTSTPTFTFTPTATTTATPTPTRQPTATPVEFTLKMSRELVNCRSGPGVVFELINELDQGQTVRVIGRNDTTTWWYIRDPGNPGGKCWISADVSEIDGDGEQLPIIQSSATNIIAFNLVVDPIRMVISCFQFPKTFFFEATLTADGPLIALLQWEANTGIHTEHETLVFEQAGTRVIYQSYQVDAANDYWMKLNILSPQPMTRQVDFRASCS